MNTNTEIITKEFITKEFITNELVQDLKPFVDLNYLAKMNKHPRDKDMTFVEQTHKYTIDVDPESIYTSVTTWTHSHFGHFNATLIIKNMMKGKNWNPQNKYWGMTAEEIKQKWSKDGQKAARLGTDLHYQIECFMNVGVYIGASWTHDPHRGQTSDLLLGQTSDILLGQTSDLLLGQTSDLHRGQTQGELMDSVYLHKDSEFALERGCGGIPPLGGCGLSSPEWSYFLDFVQAFPHLKPYRTEWRVYDEDIKIAGSIDMIYEEEDGSLSIYDWKRCKEIERTSAFKKHAKTECINYVIDTNFWHYSLQLNMYKYILENKYGKKIKDVFLVQLHEENPRKTFELIRVAELKNEMAKLIELRKIELYSLPLSSL
jgi:hypothetical protein